MAITHLSLVFAKVNQKFVRYLTAHGVDWVCNLFHRSSFSYFLQSLAFVLTQFAQVKKKVRLTGIGSSSFWSIYTKCSISFLFREAQTGFLVCTRRGLRIEHLPGQAGKLHWSSAWARWMPRGLSSGRNDRRALRAEAADTGPGPGVHTAGPPTWPPATQPHTRTGSSPAACPTMRAGLGRIGLGHPPGSALGASQGIRSEKRGCLVGPSLEPRQEGAQGWPVDVAPSSSRKGGTPALAQR